MEYGRSWQTPAKCKAKSEPNEIDEKSIELLAAEHIARCRWIPGNQNRKLSEQNGTVSARTVGSNNIKRPQIRLPGMYLNYPYLYSLELFRRRFAIKHVLYRKLLPDIIQQRPHTWIEFDEDVECSVLLRM